MKRSIFVAWLVLLSLACRVATPTPAPLTTDLVEAARQTMAAATVPPTPTTSPTPSPPPTNTPMSGPSGCVDTNAPVQVGFMTNLVDGDTIDVMIDGQEYRVRYIGIDAPATDQPDRPAERFGSQAAEANRALVENQVLMLVKDVLETDPNGWLLRYVFVGDLNGVFVNYELARKGYASPAAYPPGAACEGTFRFAAEMAKTERLGLWAP